MATRIQIRRGNSSQWGSSDPVLAAGELSVDNDTLKMKVSDGSSNYSKLKYLRAERPDNLFLGSYAIYAPLAISSGFVSASVVTFCRVETITVG